MLKEKDLLSPAEPTWCKGCGNYSIFAALRKVIVKLVNEEGYKRENFVLVTGIGCHGKMANYININSYHVIHGRVLPFATAVKMANPELIVVGHAGDGDAYAIGVAHLIHAAKRNIPVVYVVHNNYRFGLTTGQVTPTTELGEKTRSTPYGNPEEPLNPLLLALSSGATFVARGFAGDVLHLASLMEQAIKHKGFAFIDVLQPCVAWDPLHTYAYWRKRVYKLENTDHDPTDFIQAVKKAMEYGDRVPIGVLYKVEKPTLMDRLPQYSEGKYPAKMVKKRDLKVLLEEFR